MARGLLTGNLDMEKLPADDVRKIASHLPQFHKDNVDEVSSLSVWTALDRLLVLPCACQIIVKVWNLSCKQFNVQHKIGVYREGLNNIEWASLLIMETGLTDQDMKDKEDRSGNQ